jgi:hypothetical protein
MKEFTFEESQVSSHRDHIITHEEAQKLVEYFDKLNDCEVWNVEDFIAKTVLQAGTWMDFGSGFADECIQHIICCLFNYTGVY